jgi:glycosyltransferase involved in cell wall biosynthesis
MGLDAHRILMRGRFDPAAVRRLARLIAHQRIDILHTHGYKSDILGLAAARLSGIPCVATPHGFENVRDLKLQAFITLGCFALRFFDKVAPLSGELKKDIKRIGVLPERIRHIQNGVDLTEIEEIRRRNGPPVFPDRSVKRIGYVGQLAFRKNLDAMIRAFDILHRTHPDTQLVLVGEGPLRNELEKNARSLPAGDAIVFLGYRKDRLEILKELDIFSMTSSLEGIPRCMMEAMALEVPVAAFEIPGVDQLIHDGRTGLLAPFGDVDALAACWERLLADEKLSARIGQAGRKHILDHFSAQRMADEYTALYREMVQSTAYLQNR